MIHYESFLTTLVKIILNYGYNYYKTIFLYLSCIILYKLICLTQYSDNF